MTLEEFYTYKEQAFDAFCKAVIRNESMDQLRALAKRASQEINLSELSEREMPWHLAWWFAIMLGTSIIFPSGNFMMILGTAWRLSMMKYASRLRSS